MSGGAADRSGPQTAPPAQAPAPHRRRRAVVLAVVGAAAAVACVAALAGGLSSSEKPRHDDAMPGTDSVTSAPESEETAPAATGAASGAPAASVPRSFHGRDLLVAAALADDADGRCSPSPADAASSGPAGSTASTAPPAVSGPPVLHSGDQGTQVKEVQLRLRQLLLYLGKTDGDYDRELEKAVGRYQDTRKIDDDEHGVYGPATRQSLEAETRKP